MNVAEGIEPITVLKTRSAELIRRARETGQPVVITQNGKPTAVLQDVESFQQQRETLLLLKALVQGDQDYRAGRTLSHTKAKARLAEVLSKLK
jgi:prevent-host-death family protein